MLRRLVLNAACMAAFLLSTGASAASRPTHRVGLVRHDNVAVYSRHSTRSRVLAVLVEQTQVEVLGRNGSWSHVAIWASVKGWVRSSEIVFRKPWESVSTYRAPEIHYHVHAHGPRGLRVSALITAGETLKRSPSGGAIGWLPLGAPVTVTGWQQDATGKIWYAVRGGWALGDGIRFLTPDPGRTRDAQGPLWKRVAGKGMWVTLGTVTDSDPDALLRAAVANGITHLYVESAISPLGFHGKDSVSHIIEAAHRRHIAVIAWVYPYLYDLASDVDLTRQVAAYRTPSGDRFDGIAEDIERNVQVWTTRAYAQLVRAYLGPHYLLVGVTYPPQDFSTYPFGEVARQDNVIAPMDYWHQTKTAYGMYYGQMAYGYAYGDRYAADSVARIRAVSGNVPVAPIGQTFDDYGRLEMGPHAPTAAEITGFMAGSKRTGAIGVSFFQWMTATDGEWRAIRAIRFG